MFNYRFTTLVDGNNVVQSVDIIIQASSNSAAWVVAKNLMDQMGIPNNDQVNPDIKLVKGK